MFKSIQPFLLKHGRSIFLSTAPLVTLVGLYLFNASQQKRQILAQKNKNPLKFFEDKSPYYTGKETIPYLRGKLNDIINNESNLINIKRIEVIREPYGSLKRDDIPGFKKLMQLIEKHQITELDLLAFDLTEEGFLILAETMKNNNTLKTLSIYGGQFFHMRALLDALLFNKTLTTLYYKSGYHYPFHYQWSKQELMALAHLIEVNKTIQNIFLPNSDIQKRQHIAFLTEPYKTQSECATIDGLEYAGDQLPPFSKENIDELDEIGQNRQPISGRINRRSL